VSVAVVAVAVLFLLGRLVHDCRLGGVRLQQMFYGHTTIPPSTVMSDSVL
jgi:hypothetical protein